MLVVNDRIAVPLAEIAFTFARSGGPGGQNVNKVNSRATLRWSIRDSSSLPEDVRLRFGNRYRNRITKNGDLVLHSDRFRDQGRNVADCLARLQAMLLEVASIPKQRRPTRRTRSSIERRLRDKRKCSQKKQLRRRPGTED